MLWFVNISENLSSSNLNCSEIFFFFLILNSERNERIIDFVFGRCDSIKLMKFNQNFIVFLQRYN